MADPVRDLGLGRVGRIAGDVGIKIVSLTDFVRSNTTDFVRILTDQLVQGIKTFITAKSQEQAIAGPNIDWSTGNLFRVTAATPVTFTFSNTADGQSISVLVPGGYAHTWPGSVAWSGATVPDHSGSTGPDIVSFIQINGVIYGSFVQDLQ